MDMERHVTKSGGYLKSNPRTCGDNSFLILGPPTSGAKRWITATYNAGTRLSSHIACLAYRKYAAVVPLGKKATMISGGCVDGAVSASVEIFSGRERQVRTLAPLEVARAYHGACAVEGAVVVCGGCRKGYSLNSCEVYYRCQVSWRPLPGMKENRIDVAVVSLPDRRVFAIGGENDTKTLSSVEVCRLPVDIDSSSPPDASFWQSFVPMREARMGHSAVYFLGNIIVVGGYRMGYLSSVEMLSIDKSDDTHWISLPLLKEERCRFTLSASTNEIFAFGNDDDPCNSVERLKLKRTSNVEQTTSTGATFDDIFAQWETLDPASSVDRIWGVVLIPTKTLQV